MSSKSRSTLSLDGAKDTTPLLGAKEKQSHKYTVESDESKSEEFAKKVSVLSLVRFQLIFPLPGEFP